MIVGNLSEFDLPLERLDFSRNPVDQKDVNILMIILNFIFIYSILYSLDAIAEEGESSGLDQDFFVEDFASLERAGWNFIKCGGFFHAVEDYSSISGEMESRISYEFWGIGGDILTFFDYEPDEIFSEYEKKKIHWHAYFQVNGMDAKFANKNSDCIMKYVKRHKSHVSFYKNAVKEHLIDKN